MTDDFELRLRLLNVDNVIATHRLEGLELNPELINDMYAVAYGKMSEDQLVHNNKIRLSQLLQE